MNGEAKTDSFMLGSATVMIGKPEELYDLNPDDHSLGLVKNFTVEATKGRTDLTQGRTNDIVFTMTTEANTRCTFEMYEYTEKNLAYALGLDGGELVAPTGEPHVVSADAAFATGEVVLTVEEGTGQNFVAGNDVAIRSALTDNIIVGKVKTVSGITDGTAASSASVTVEIPDSNSTQEVKAGDFVSLVTVLGLGSTDVDRDYAVKAIGQLANGKPVTYLMPKVRVTSGLTMAFGTSDFGNTAMEMSPLKVTSVDPYYAAFKGLSGKLVMGSEKAALA